jgi:periplasmic copper chaperone A
MRRRIGFLLVVSALALAAPLPTLAQAVPPTAPPAAQPAAGVSVTKAWARATAADAQTGAAYMTFTNTGPADALVGASTPVATTAELHRTTADANGVMQMRPVQSLSLAHGKAVMLAPMGYHMMLIGLKQPLKAGDTFPLTLTFQKAAPVTVTVAVQGAGASSPGGMNMGAMPGMGH